MNLVPWKKRNSLINGFDVFDDVEGGFDQLFQDVLGWPLAGTVFSNSSLSPAIDVIESEDAVTIKADLPGIDKKSLDVSVQDGALAIKGEQNRESELKKKDFVRTERYHGSFRRVIPLPAGVDTTQIKGSYQNGVLELTLPKREEAKPKSIKVDID